MMFSNKPSGVGDAIGRLHGIVSSFKALGPTAQFLGVGILGLIGVVVADRVVVGGPSPFSVLAGAGFYSIAFALALLALRKTYPHDAIGYCNVVTIARLMLVAILIAGLVAQTAAPWAMFAVAALAFVMDGADGWLARREGYISTFGARFDVEVDSALALVLAISAFQSGNVGAYVIILGLPRYLFLFAQYPFPWLNGDLPARFSRKVVCVVQIAALLLVTAPIVSAPIAGIAAGIAALALIWSFWLDLRLLWRERGC
jgi:phosphatidylglycerophosphate synthase